MKAVYAGSFSPPTRGHLDIIARAAGLFDELIVAVMSQSGKRYVFSPEARREMLEEITREMANVRVVSDEGLLVDLIHREGADVVVRGLRGPDDVAFEAQMAEANRRSGGVETVFLICRPEYSMISSTIVRDCAAHGAPLESMVPDEIVGKIYRAFGVQPGAERKG